AVVPNADLYAVAQVLRCGSEGWLIPFALVLIFALGRRIEAVGDQVQESPCDLLREYVDLTDVWIKGLLHIKLEALLLCAGTTIGEIETLLDESVDIDWPVFS